MKIPLLQRQPLTVSLIFGTQPTTHYDSGELHKIQPKQITSTTFSTRSERKAFLAGLGMGLDQTCARLLNNNDVLTIEDMDEMQDIKDHLTTINGVI